MTRQPSDLFKKRSTTKEFLFSLPDESVHTEDDIASGSRCEIGKELPAARFADMLSREKLAATISSSFADVPRLCVVAVQIESADVQGGLTTEGVLADAVEAMVTVCREHGGLWARLDRCRFAFAFADLDANGGRRLAEKMQRALADGAAPLMTAGIAAFPTANDSRAETVGNAEKALDHAGFFGSGSITEFDAVSLNISGDRRYQQGDIQGAVNEFRRGLQLAPSDTNLLNSLGVCYGVVGAYTKALDTFETVIWLDPDGVMAVYNKGYVLLCQGKREKALECFLAADGLEAGVFEVVFHIGQLYMEAGDAQKARPYLEAAARANNRSGPAYRHLGACLDQLGLTKEAVQAYKAVVKINPDDAASLSTLGRLYVKRGESLDVAAALCEQSVQIDPDNGRYRYRLGCVFLELGKLDTALAEFELAATLGHDSRKKIEETQDRMMAAKAV